MVYLDTGVLEGQNTNTFNRSNGVPHSSENNRLPNHDTPPRKGSQLLTRFEVRNKDVV